MFFEQPDQQQAAADVHSNFMKFRNLARGSIRSSYRIQKDYPKGTPCRKDIGKIVAVMQYIGAWARGASYSGYIHRVYMG